MLIERLKLAPGEIITATVRKHWFILFAQTIGLVLLGAIPLIVAFFALTNSFFEKLPIDITEVTDPIIFFASAWFLIVWMMIFSTWTDYYLDMWTITNKRVIAINQKGLFNRSIASFRLERLQDLNIRINGIIATALDFGTIEAETASHDDEFTIRGIPNPREVKAMIQGSADKIMAERATSSTASVSDDGV